MFRPRSRTPRRLAAAGLVLLHVSFAASGCSDRTASVGAPPPCERGSVAAAGFCPLDAARPGASR